MDIKFVIIILAFNVISARTTCKGYEQINKENIRNCYSELDNKILELNHTRNLEDKNYNFSNNVVVKLTNNSLSISFRNIDDGSRKMKQSTSNLIQYALIPAFFMSGVMPWIMPKLQMVVMVLSMMNNMVFSSALFTLIRNFVFDKEPNKHVIYVNHGYKNKHR